MTEALAREIEANTASIEGKDESRLIRQCLRTNTSSLLAALHVRPKISKFSFFLIATGRAGFFMIQDWGLVNRLNHLGHRFLVLDSFP